MEDLSHDPEFAQEFVKLLGVRLKEAKRALDEARTVRYLWSNDTVCQNTDTTLSLGK